MSSLLNSLVISNNRFWDARPSLLRDMILVDIDIVSVSIQGMIEYQRCVHKGARIDHGAALFDNHAFKVKDKDSIEDLERKSTLSSEYHDLLICDLISIRHVSRDPLRLIATASRNFLP